MKKLNYPKLDRVEGASLLGLSVRQLSNLVSAGVISKAGCGKSAHYLAPKLVQEWVGYQMERLRPPDRQDAASLEQAELRKANANAHLTEMRAAKMGRELVDVAWVISSESAIGNTMRDFSKCHRNSRPSL